MILLRGFTAMDYVSTRNKNLKITSCQAILQGISEDGGLFLPEKIPVLKEDLNQLLPMDYKDLAFTIMKYFFTDFEERELRSCIQKAYDNKFDTPVIVPVVKKKDVYFLELFHGPTLAFKDIALSILPHLLTTALNKLKINKEVLILTATSGDTGKAALQAFSNVNQVRIMVFYPQKGVSEIQKRQMITHEGSNTRVVGIEGNFDDAQSGVKKLFHDPDLKEKLDQNNIMLSSANSINIGRLIPQVVYYFYGYLNLLKNKEIHSGENINVVVPTGNFGNILAAYYAKKMGLPIHKLICASNENNVLTDFFRRGEYDVHRSFKMTSSPSMDILISSNLERLLFEISGGDDTLTKKLISSLQSKGKYTITKSMEERLEDFYGNFAWEEEVFESISKLFQNTDYVMDPHTAVAYKVYEKYQEKTRDATKTLIASTANPFKFGKSVGKALGLEIVKDDFQILDKISDVAKLEIPKNIKELKNKKILHPYSCKKEEMQEMVADFVKV